LLNCQLSCFTRFNEMFVFSPSAPCFTLPEI
jgi:hypothetical protein